MEYKVFKHPDLHMHSTFSDGTDTPEALLKKVKENNIDIFALTDHDTYGGAQLMRTLLKEGDPYFIAGVELSCEDDDGKYHILGYCYDASKQSIQDAIELAHSSRITKMTNRFDFLRNLGYEFSQKEIDDIMALENPGKPHLAALMVEKGYCKDKKEGFDILAKYHGTESRLTPEEAISAILHADGIPVLAHAIFGAGSKHLSNEETEYRVKKLKKLGLMGLECFYSTFTSEQVEFMLSLATKYNLLVTAGSDYHGKAKTVKLGDTGGYDEARMRRFYMAVASLIEKRS